MAFSAQGLCVALPLHDGRATDVAFSAQELCVAFPLTVSTHAPLQGLSPDKVDHALDQTRTALQDVSALGDPDKVDHALDDHAHTSLQDVSALCGMCDDKYPPLVPIGGCGKPCCNGSDPLMPDMVFDEPDEFALLQAQNAYARRATYGIHGAAPGVQMSWS